MARLKQVWQQVILMVAVLNLYACAALAISNDTDILEASIDQLQQALSAGELTSVQLVEQYLARIDAYDQQNTAINALIRLNPDALKRATELDRERRRQGPRGPLHGIPIIVKDNFNTQGLATSAGSAVLAGFVPKRDGFQVRKLKQAGAIILAKANMDELARDVNGNSALGGQTKNPYDLARNPGGSSAGTAAAIAANFATVGMGTDTCGSLRLPASFNNLVSLRPSKGLSSIAGIVPLSAPEDVAGPMGRSVKDVALMMDTVAGFDSEDPATTAVQNRASFRFTPGLETVDISTLRLGKYSPYFNSSPHSAVTKVMDQAFEQLQAAGATIVEIETERFTSIIEALLEPDSESESPYAVTFPEELARFLQNQSPMHLSSAEEIVQQGLYHEFIDRWIPFKTFINSVPDKIKRQSQAQWRALLRQAITQTLQDKNLDALVYPSASALPTVLGGTQQGNNCGLSANSGTPALAMPAGFTESGLPVGLELLAPAFSDEKLVAIGHAIEQVLKARRAPANTPALVNGKAPKPVLFKVQLGEVVEVAFAFNPTNSQLSYKTQYLEGEALQTEDIYAVCLHRAKQGPIIQCLSGIEGRRSSGVVALNAAHRQALNRKELTLRLYSAQSPKGQVASALVFPQ